jgi:hypothetical protein
MTDKSRWPAWCNGPNDETAIFNSPDELPTGWYHPRLDKKPTAKSQLDHDGKAGGAKKPKPLDL